MSDILLREMMDVIERFNLKNKVLALSADNTNTNFGGEKRLDTCNVYSKLKAKLERDIFGLGCNAHVIHNAYTIDVEGFVRNVFKHFYIFTVRVAKLNEFCDFVGQEY